MNNSIFLLVLVLLTGSHAMAQSPTARFKFEDAEAAFASADYRTALVRLEEAEQEFGRINPPILYLRIMTRNELLKSENNLDFDNLEQLRRDSARFLKEYGALDVMLDQAREVYRVSESLRDYPATRLAYIDNLIAEHWYQEALDEVARVEQPPSPPAQYRKILAMHRVVQMEDYINVERAEALRTELQAFLKNANGRQPAGINAHQWRDALQIEINLSSLEDYRLAKRFHYTERDYAQAMVYYRRGADKGNAMAFTGLGLLHDEGRGKAQDHAAARPYYERAASLGHSWAFHLLGLSYNRSGIDQDYSKAREWYERGVAVGNHWSIYWLGNLYHMGHGTPQDYVRSRQLFELSGRLGNPDALRALGIVHANGQGVPQDYVKARDWYLQAAGKGNASAMNDIGLLYHHGHGIERDYAQAKAWFEKAQAKGNLRAMSNLGNIYSYAWGVEKNYKMAVEWYTKAADKGDADAMRRLAEIYGEGGHGIKRDKKLAREWRDKAERAGAK